MQSVQKAEVAQLSGLAHHKLLCDNGVEVEHSRYGLLYSRHSVLQSALEAFALTLSQEGLVTSDLAII